jgi:SAM-dependent methyltransferase
VSTALRPAGAAPDRDAGQTLQAQREAWEARPLVRALYHDWYRGIAGQLASVRGPTVELGCGIGSFKEFMPEVVATDVIDSPWSDEVIDAQELPYADGSVANLVMVDVIHHLAQPLRTLEEAGRVLVPGGRVVALEPFCSPLSRPLYRRFHQERLNESVDPWSDRSQTGRDPWDANIALPTLLFWRDRGRLRQRLPELGLVARERLAWLAYPLSGGFFGRPLAPRRLGGLLRRVDAALPLERVAAFRCLVTLEKRAA